MAATDTPQGVLAVVDEPAASWEVLRAAEGVLVLDAVQDPGNVGTLARTAVGLGLGGVVVLDGTADPWGPKAVRASAGAMFHAPPVRAGADDLASWSEREGVALLAGAASGTDVARCEAPAAWALVLGNEGAGVRPELAQHVRAVAVPLGGRFESLNVAQAGAILMYALKLRAPSDGGRE
ncbi:MAG: RNA methyltransferase [Gemmatimonadetes bacterium]|nr:MAG: RNA methyltransferase [Gemmatimonadota bacterium]